MRFGNGEIRSEERVSKNLAATKGAAALVVMLGHYTSIPNFWVVVAVALLVFSISSGYFTAQRYRGEFSWKRFWRRKVVRLFPRLVLIEIFLLMLFLAQGRDGIWTWQTAVNLVGMNGFLNWFRIQNISPYGAGMWFLTLLLVFYAVYPLLERFYESRRSAWGATAVGVAVLFFLHRNVEYGHALWLTASGFLAGMMLDRGDIRFGKRISACLLVASGAATLIAHSVFGFDEANFFFILIVAISLLCFIEYSTIPPAFLSCGAWFSGMLLEIYLLHPYLRMEPTGIQLVDVSSSIVLVIVASAVLSGISMRMGWTG